MIDLRELMFKFGKAPVICTLFPNIMKVCGVGFTSLDECSVEAFGHATGVSAHPICFVAFCICCVHLLATPISVACLNTAQCSCWHRKSWKVLSVSRSGIPPPRKPNTTGKGVDDSWKDGCF